MPEHVYTTPEGRAYLEKSRTVHKQPFYYTDELRALLMGSPEYQRCVGYDQRNPHHCFTLDQHMQETEKYIEDMAPNCNWLACAAAIHDIGKPEKAFKDPKTGYYRYFGHAAASADIAHDLLTRLGLPEDITETVCWFIRHHDDFISFVLEPVPDHPYRRTVSVQNIAEVILMSYLDIPGSDIDVNATVRFLLTGRKPAWGHVAKTWSLRHQLPDVPDARNAFTKLLWLCKADSLSQAEVTCKPDGSIQTTRAEKVAVDEKILELLPDAILLAETALKKITRE